MLKKFQCHILDRRIIVKICISKVTADCTSLEEFCMVSRIPESIANLNERNTQRNIKEELFPDFQCQIIQNYWIGIVIYLFILLGEIKRFLKFN